MKEVELISENAAQTAALGKKLALRLTGGETIGITGQLGSGKTTLVKAFLDQLGEIKGFSPTFVIDAVYNIKIGQKSVFLHHLDLYRLENQEELLTLGILEFLGDPEHIFLIEWAERFVLLPSQNKLIINLVIIEQDKRQINLKAIGDRHEKILANNNIF